MSLTFDADQHEYRWHGRVVPSVTQILEDVGVVDYSFIPSETRKMALHRGSMVHLACQLYDERDLAEATLDPAIVPYLNAWKRFLSETGFVIETDEIEKRFFHNDWQYAGTRDRRGRLNGMPTVLDIKTNDAHPAVRMQLAAYCAFERFPSTVGRIAVELRGDETYRVIDFPVREHARDFNDFICCLRAYQLKRELGGRQRSIAA